MKIYFSGGIFMAGVSRVNEVVNAINYVGDQVEKMGTGYESISADKIFKDKKVKVCMPKDENNPKKTSVQEFFCNLKKAVEEVRKKYNSLKNKNMKENEKAEELKKVWTQELNKCQNVVKYASNKSRIKDKRVQKAIEQLKNIKFIKNNESQDKGKLSKSKYNLKKRLEERNRRIRDIVDSINEYITRIEKYYRLESYSSKNIYVLKDMYEDCFSKYINEKTTSGKYFSECKKRIRELDFAIYEKFGGFRNINDDMRKDCPNITERERERLYVEASGKFKTGFPRCIPTPGEDYGPNSTASILNAKKVNLALKDLRNVPKKCKDLTIINYEFNRTQGTQPV